jgi:signal transduction histidine kinase
VALAYLGDTSGEWDGDRLGQVLQNLVSNAIKYGAPGSPIDAAIHDLGDTVQVAISNRGVPIPEADREHLFDPFRRGARAKKGAGLGLYIAHQIVRAHGGTLDFTSDEVATVFRVSLPRR